MGDNKRRETTSLRSTSGRHDSPAPVGASQTQTVNVGCMSGIFHLISKYHTRRKFLTFAKKQEKEAPSPPKPETTGATATTTITITCKPRNTPDSPETTGMSSLEAPRSPAIPSEIRNSGSAKSPRVVARLMGIEDIPTSPLVSVVAESAAEKRRKLLGALEKCDEDLKALKKIIDVVRASQTPPRAAVKMVEEEAEETEDEPSPVSVLDFYDQKKLVSRSSSPLTGQYSKRTRNGEQKRKDVKKLKPREEEYNSAFLFPNKPTPPHSSIVDITTLRSIFLPTKTRASLITNVTARKSSNSSSLPWSKAVVETVEEVCRDVEWGQRSEVGRLVLLIQDFIFKDLIEEITKEMVIMTMMKRSRSFDYVFGSSRIVSLPKRKLCF